jgi:hypothetical protein
LRQAVTPSPWLLLLFLEKIISHQSLLRRGNPGTRGNLTSEKTAGWLAVFAVTAMTISQNS